MGDERIFHVALTKGRKRRWREERHVVKGCGRDVSGLGEGGPEPVRECVWVGDAGDRARGAREFASGRGTVTRRREGLRGRGGS